MHTPRIAEVLKSLPRASRDGCSKSKIAVMSPAALVAADKLFGALAKAAYHPHNGAETRAGDQATRGHLARMRAFLNAYQRPVSQAAARAGGQPNDAL